MALAASVFFYAWGAPVFIFIVAASIAVDFIAVKEMHKSTGRKKKLLVAFSILLNIGLLLYFKYANFFVENFNVMLEAFGGKPAEWTKVALPIGISFFSFQKMTYAVDVYRKVHTPLKRMSDFALYILMFPQLIAGPIVRFNEIADQLEDRRYNENVDNRITGFFRFTLGLGKKVLIANVMGEYADSVFAMDPSAISSATAWMGVIAYTFQIYYDFAGYSAMAIGLGRMIGFDFLENFNNPYISQNISEFWRRWHISLGRWMRDYLYIPLGGNRVSTRRMYFNLWFVFLISGFWHGAAWTFIIWGAFHGFFLIADRLFLLKFYSKIGKYPAIVITFVITMVGWVFFRSENLPYAIDFISRMFSFTGGPAVYISQKVWIILIFAAVFGFWGAFGKVEQWQTKLFAKKQQLSTLVMMTAASIVLFIVSLAAITSSGFNPFIYFRF